MCGVSTQKGPSNQINIFERTRQSERVVRHCDDTVDKKRVNSCVQKHLFLERVEQPKISPKKPGNALSDVLLMSCFQNFAPDAAKKNVYLVRLFFPLVRCPYLPENLAGPLRSSRTSFLACLSAFLLFHRSYLMALDCSSF